jgi:hypothetical protein
MTIYGLINLKNSYFQIWFRLELKKLVPVHPCGIVLSLVDTSNSVGNFSPPWGCDLTNEMTHAKDLEMHAS